MPDLWRVEALAASAGIVHAARMRNERAWDAIPDVRDGLTRIERIVLRELHAAQPEFDSGSVPTALLYGRVVEHVPLSVDEFQNVLRRLVGRG